jgi:transcriptional regulator with XRE-family HTH domain
MPTIRRSPLHLALRDILATKRKTAGLNQIELAERLNRPQSYISKVENGERRIDVIEFLEFADALGCTAEDILVQLRASDRSTAVPKAGWRRRQE